MSDKKTPCNIDFSLCRRSRRKRRGNSRYILLFLLISFLLISTLYGFFFAIRNLSLFNVKAIIIAGNTNLDEEFLKELAGEFIGSNLYSIPLKTIGYKYDNIVRIDRLRIRRVFPNKLKIIVQERIGYMYIKTVEGLLIPVDVQKTILDKRGSYLSEDLPIIHTELRERDLVVGKVLEDDHVDRVYEIHKYLINGNIDEKIVSEYYLRNNDLHLIDSGTGSSICLGRKQYSEKLQKLEFILDNMGIEPGTYIDLRFADQVVIRSESKR